MYGSERVEFEPFFPDCIFLSSDRKRHKAAWYSKSKRRIWLSRAIIMQ